MSPTIALYAFANFIIGTGAFVLGGLLSAISLELDIGIATAGQAMTAYAIAAGLLAPGLVVLTGHWSRRRTVALALALCALGNLVCAIATALPVLLAGRVLMGAGTMFAALSAGLAVAESAPQHRGRALSLVYLGVSLSFVLGLPLGTYLAALSTWRAPVLLLAAASVIALALLMWRMPRDLPAAGTRLAGLGALVGRPDIAAPLALTWLYATAIFCTFSYIGPVLQALGPMSPATVSFTLMGVGVAGVAGTLAGGWAADRVGPVTALRGLLGLFLLAQAAVPLTAGHYSITLLVLMAWCASGFAVMPAQQARLAAASPGDTPVLLSLNSALLNLGTASGAAIGGLASAWLGMGHLAWAGVPFIVLGLITLRA